MDAQAQKRKKRRSAKTQTGKKKEKVKTRFSTIKEIPRSKIFVDPQPEADDAVDIVYQKAVDLFTENGYIVSAGSNSKTDYGHSRYFYVNYKGKSDEHLGLGYKVRVSDHGVESHNRIFSEIHIDAFSPLYGYALMQVDLKFKPELFEEKKTSSVYVRELRVGGDEYHPDTDRIIQDLGLSKRGKQSYLVKRTKTVTGKVLVYRKSGKSLSDFLKEKTPTSSEPEAGAQITISDSSEQSSEPLLFDRSDAGDSNVKTKTEKTKPPKFTPEQSKKKKAQAEKMIASTEKKLPQLTEEQVLKIGRMFETNYRSLYSQALDESSDNKRRLSPTPENLVRWMKSPGKYDLIGVDTFKQSDATADYKSIIAKQKVFNLLGVKI